MLPSLALLLLAAWTVRALEVGAAPWERDGGGGRREDLILPTTELESGEAGGSHGYPALRRPRLRVPCASASLAQPYPGTRCPTGGEGAGEARGSPYPRLPR